MIHPQAGFLPEWSQRPSASNFSLISLFYFSPTPGLYKYIFRERGGSFWRSPLPGLAKPYLTSRETEAQSRRTEPAGVTFKVSKLWLIYLLLLLQGGGGWQGHHGAGSLHPLIPRIFHRRLLTTLVCVHHSTAPGTSSFSLEALEWCLPSEWREDAFSLEQQSPAA